MPKKTAESEEDWDLMDNDVENNDASIEEDDEDKGIDDEIKRPAKFAKDNSKNKLDSLSKVSFKEIKKNKSVDKKSSEVNSKSTSLIGEKKGLNSDIKNEEEENDSDSKFFVVRVSGGQESLIASMLQSRLSTKKIDGIYSILFLDAFKGYVIVESMDSNIAHEALYGIRHIRGQIRGELPFKDLEGYLIKKPVVTELVIDDTVEIIAGPFKSMKAKIMRVDYEKQEATVVLLDSPYQIPVTVDANYLKKTL
ncbi:MAG: transcription elongation factor Spt5, partial [Candidatus Nitrosocosmicus sp.]